MAYQPIENYGIIGDMHTVALVGTPRAVELLGRKAALRRPESPSGGFCVDFPGFVKLLIVG